MSSGKGWQPLEKAGKWRRETCGVVAERATGVPHGTKEGR